jgi:NAD(P)-dependent dehydrogenase (short-subunit alcohol dehydrogenase family)
MPSECFILLVVKRKISMKSESGTNTQRIFELHGKTALVTGASKGLGLAFSEALARAGARVVLSGRALNQIENVALNLRAKNLDVIAIEIDVQQENSLNAALAFLEAEGERIDILINNAAIGHPTPLFQPDPKHHFEQVIKTNLIGTWYVTKSIANHMKLNNVEGSIINIASVNGETYPYKENTAYAVSKAAIIHMTKSLALELSAYKIRINALSPGPVKSSLYGAAFEHNWDFWRDKIPLGFLAEPSDLFGALIFLASNNASRFMTGSCITIDGGLSLRE